MPKYPTTNEWQNFAQNGEVSGSNLRWQVQNDRNMYNIDPNETKNRHEMTFTSDQQIT